MLDSTAPALVDQSNEVYEYFLFNHVLPGELAMATAIGLGLSGVFCGGGQVFNGDIPANFLQAYGTRRKKNGTGTQVES